MCTCSITMEPKKFNQFGFEIAIIHLTFYEIVFEIAHYKMIKNKSKYMKSQRV